jgi:hypothetical protein
MSQHPTTSNNHSSGSRKQLDNNDDEDEKSPIIEDGGRTPPKALPSYEVGVVIIIAAYRAARGDSHGASPSECSTMREFVPTDTES